MAKRGGLSDFVMRKVREGTRKAMEDMAFNTVKTLQKAGPYWDGYFANEWVVRQGDVDIPAFIKGAPTGKRFPDIIFRELTDPVIPPADLRKGYTIGNQMEYRAIAMDLEPGRIKVEGGGTAEQDWYTNLMEGGELIRINKQAAQAAFKEAFK